MRRLRSPVSRSAPRYLALLAGTVLSLCAVAALLNVAVDPYYVFGTPLIYGFNQVKPAAYNHQVAAKTYLLERVHPRTLLLGNSRVAVGFDPESSAWPATMQPVFNGGLSGRGLDIAAKLLEDALAEPGLRHVVVGVDFIDFIAADAEREPPGPVDAGPDQDRMRLLPNFSRNPWRFYARLKDDFEGALTIGAVDDSVLTVLGQTGGATETITPRGLDPRKEYYAFARKHGFRALFDDKDAAYVSWVAGCSPPVYSDPNRFRNVRALREIMKVSRSLGLDLTLVIYPYHAWFMDLILRYGLWDSFESWKRMLVREVATQMPGERVRIVDFSGYNEYTTELVPPAGDTHTAMLWYWEEGHFRASLGDQMIRRLFDGEADGFGQELAEASIEQVLARIRAEAAARPRILSLRSPE